ncbi:lipoprotein [Streptomyces spiroverticillatus]|uniref:Lipoprotein n=1 Tax=Streptomyces finlayi TaxID=67296 RepID=A0A919CCY1_9ACTN|nr:hypothetical protein [Streptomyces finlayi]GHA28463.1 lipoprotein [Streptomyces spiroverticillatus]GHD09149.1 lipoprotein [Streptomyces finlayi]
MTRTAATLLVGVAVSAVSGCVSAGAGQPAPPAAQSPAAQQPRPPQLPHLIGNGGDPEELVEAPVHEVLEAALLPSERAPEPAAAPPVPREPRHHADTDAPAQPPARRAAAPESAPHKKPKPHHEPDRKKPALPKLPTSAADVCALGTGYGGWKPNSPEARICRETYGG